MSQESLRLRFDDDHDGTGKLIASVEFGGFAGHGGAYFSVTELEQFAEAMVVYPIPAGQRPAIAGGFWREDGCHELEQEHLAIAVYAIGRRGQVGVRVRIATELMQSGRPDSQNVVQVELLTTYEAIALFSRRLRSLVRGEVAEAVLETEPAA
jgi:hypothetical protein